MKLILRIVAPAPNAALCALSPSSVQLVQCRLLHVIELRVTGDLHTVEIRVASELHAAKIRVTVVKQKKMLL
jgi:hypothetical protein